MQEIMLADIIRDYLHHRTIQIGVNCIPDMKTEGFIAVNSYTGGQEFCLATGHFRKEIRDLAAFDIDNSNGLALFHIDPFAGAGRNKEFHIYRAFFLNLPAVIP